MKWIVIAALILFAGGIMYTTMTSVQAECEVCLEFNGDLVCRRGGGATEEEARQAAQESACGGNAFGMSEMIACRNAVPVQTVCTGG